MSIENYLKVKHENKAMADKPALRKAAFRRITEQRIKQGCSDDTEQELEVETVQHGGGIYQESNKEGVGERKRRGAKGKSTLRAKGAKKTRAKG